MNDADGNTNLDEFIYIEFIESSKSDDEDAELMMKDNIHEEMEKRIID